MRTGPDFGAQGQAHRARSCDKRFISVGAYAVRTPDRPLKARRIPAFVSYDCPVDLLHTTCHAVFINCWMQIGYLFAYTDNNKRGKGTLSSSAIFTRDNSADVSSNNMRKSHSSRCVGCLCAAVRRGRDRRPSRIMMTRSPPKIQIGRRGWRRGNSGDWEASSVNWDKRRR